MCNNIYRIIPIKNNYSKVMNSACDIWQPNTSLKERVFEGLRLSIEGLIVHKPNGLDPERDLFMCRTQGLVFLYRLSFILFAEDRVFLPYQKNDVYTRNRSLARFRGEVATKLDLVEGHLDRGGYG